MNEERKKIILIVEDDETVLEFLKFALENDGFQVETAKDGIKAMEKVESLKPDLIVLDMMLPQKSGFEIIKMLQTPEYIDIPVIVATGRFVDDNFRKMLEFETNVKEYIVKPVKAEYLIYKIHKILGTKTSPKKTE